MNNDTITNVTDDNITIDNDAAITTSPPYTNTQILEYGFAVMMIVIAILCFWYIRTSR